MKEIKKIRIIAIVAFIVAIASLTVSYSFLNTIKEIKGIATVDERKFGLIINNFSNISSSEDSNITRPEILGKTINFGCNLKTINSYCSFDFELVNEGDFDAIINKIVFTGLNNDHVTYEITGLKEKNIIKAKDTVKATIKLTYNDFPREVFEEVKEEVLKDLSLEINFGQVQ